MKRIIVALMLAMVVATITAGAAMAAPTNIDPDTLTPPPPEGALCYASGKYVICRQYSSPWRRTSRSWIFRAALLT